METTRTQEEGWIILKHNDITSLHFIEKPTVRAQKIYILHSTLYYVQVVNCKQLRNKKCHQ